MKKQIKFIYALLIIAIVGSSVATVVLREVGKMDFGFDQSNLFKVSDSLITNNKTLTNMKKEGYFLSINESGVKTELFVNGISVYSGNMGASWDEPVTKYMKNGDNKVEINVTKTAEGPNDVSCSFGYGYVLNSDLSEDIVYSDKKFVCGESLKKNGVENFTFNIKTNLPFGLPWENGKKFEDNQATKEILFAKYKEMQNVLGSLDESRIKEFFQYQLERKSQYMYTPKEDIDKKYFEMIKRSLDDDNVTMVEILPIDKLTLQISKDGLIARLIKINKMREEEPFSWRDNEIEVNIFYPVWFMMTQDNQIVPIL